VSRQAQPTGSNRVQLAHDPSNQVSLAAPSVTRPLMASLRSASRWLPVAMQRRIQHEKSVSIPYGLRVIDGSGNRHELLPVLEANQSRT
jgi:hypothetical protein